MSKKELRKILIGKINSSYWCHVSPRDYEAGILKQLFPKKYKELFLSEDVDRPDWYGERIELDRKMCEMARRSGHDSIVLLNPAGKKSLERNRKPWSMELNLLYA